MSAGKKKMNDDDLRGLLNDSWKSGGADERRTFLHRMKIVLPSGHPGLLCVPGRTKNGGTLIAEERNMKRKRLTSTLAAWGFVAVCLVVLIFAYQRFFIPGTNPDEKSSPGGITGNTRSKDNEKIAKAEEDKYVYQFGETRIIRSTKLTNEELAAEIEKMSPAGLRLFISDVKETSSYNEETDTTLFHVFVYEVTGDWRLQTPGPNPDNNSEGTIPPW